jgi:hypothetical protein
VEGDHDLGDAVTNLKKTQAEESKVSILTAAPVARMALAAQD